MGVPGLLRHQELGGQEGPWLWHRVGGPLPLAHPTPARTALSHEQSIFHPAARTGRQLLHATQVIKLLFQHSFPS